MVAKDHNVASIRYLLELMPVFSHVPREVHLRRAKYRRHYTKSHYQTFDIASEVASLQRMRGAICFLCGETDGIELATILAAPYEEHLCPLCQANLLRIVKQHQTLTARLRAIAQLPMFKQLANLCADLERETRYEHLRITPDANRGLDRAALWQAHPQRGPRTRSPGAADYRHDED